MTMKRLAAAFIIAFVGVLALPALASQRPPVMGRTAAVSTGHPLTTAATLEILHKGGNAFDAGVTAMLVGGVLEQDLYSLGGEGNALLYPRREGKVIRSTARVGRRDSRPSSGSHPKPDDGRDGSRSGGGAWRDPHRAHRARTVGNHDVRAGLRARDRLRGATGSRCGR